MDLAFGRRWKLARAYGAAQIKALLQITSGAAAAALAAGRPLTDFLEQVSRHSRRLANLSVPLAEVLQALREYDGLLDPALANSHPERADRLSAARKRLRARTALAVNIAYQQVNESETQALCALLRAEAQATLPEDLLRRFTEVFTLTFHAQAGQLVPILSQRSLSARTVKRLAMPRFVRGGSAEEKLILDAAMRGRYQSYWSVPFLSDGHLAAVVQFGFAAPRLWSPRELELLARLLQRCVPAAERVLVLHDLSIQSNQLVSLASRLLGQEAERHNLEPPMEGQQPIFPLRRQLDQLAEIAAPEFISTLTDSRAAAERIIEEIRQIVAALEPSVLPQPGLVAAIRQLTARFRKVLPIKVRLRLASGLGRWSPETEIVIYRILRERYENIALTSVATHVDVSLRASGPSLELTVHDDGAERTVDASASLNGMGECVALLGGRFDIRSGAVGTVINVALPIRPYRSTAPKLW